MQITLGKMRKKPNSTKRTLSASTNITVLLKEETFIENPTFILHTDPSGYNYVVWGEKYYYIDCNNVRVNANNLWEVPCNMDILATYRDTIRYGLSGRIAYSTYSAWWDEFVDDLRFSPSYLRRSNSLFEDLSYLHTNGNVFGTNVMGYPKLWDFSNWTLGDDNIYRGSLGEGMYILVANSTHGRRTYALNEHGMHSMFNAHNLWGLAKTDLKCIISLIWMPIAYGLLRDEITGQFDNSVIQDNPTIYVNDSQNGINLTDSADKSMEIFVNPLVLNFQSYINFPKIPEDIPYFCYNGRWNTMQLNTPSGSTSINLDRIYPYSWGSRKLSFNTKFDLLNGIVNTKFITDVTQGWSDGESSVIYETNMNIAIDVMGLIDKRIDTKSMVASYALDGFGTGVVAGSAILGGVGVASAINKAGGTFYAGEVFRSGAAKIGEVASSNIGRQVIGNSVLGATIGAFGSGSALKPSFDAIESNCSFASNFASFFNTVQLGLISLRLKPYTCKEFLDAPTSPKQTYIDFCSKFGYPVNKFSSSNYTFNLDNNYMLFDEVYLDTNSGYAMVDGLSEYDICYIIDTVRNAGVWLEQ